MIINITKPQKMVLIGLIGKKQVGKDTFSDFLVEHYHYIKYAFAQPLKEACRILFLLSEDQLHTRKKEQVITDWNMSPREIFQFVGTDLFRTHFRDDFWIHHFRLWYQDKTDINVVVSDIRFQNEADAIKELGGILVKIERDTQYDDPHPSEQQEISGYDYSITNNDSLSVFYNNVKQILMNI